MKTNPNDPAFATPDNGTETMTTWQGQTGLTKREYFAAKAMQGILANPNLNKYSKDTLVNIAVSHAESIIIELNKYSE